MSEYIEERITELEIQVKKLIDKDHVREDNLYNLWRAISKLTKGLNELKKPQAEEVNQDTSEFVRVRRGHWIYKDTWGNFECSVCGSGAIRNDYPYCMWCGAKMDEDDTAPSEEAYDDFYAKHRD